MFRTNTSALFKALAEGLEVLVILLIGFGLFIYSSTTTFLEQTKAPVEQAYNSFDFYFLILYELLALAVIVLILKWRNWRIKDFNLDFKLYMVVTALFLVVFRFMLNELFNWVLEDAYSINYKSLSKPEIGLEISVVSIILMIVVNSVFEEFILIGYLFKKFERFHLAIPILLSLLVRVSFHTYQGLEEIPRVVALALVFGLYYGLHKKLWPIILAHALGNLLYILNYQYQWIDLG